MDYRVQLTVQAYQICLSHALISDKLEYMGVLAGAVDTVAGVKTICIWHAGGLPMDDQQRGITLHLQDLTEKIALNPPVQA